MSNYLLLPTKISKLLEDFLQITVRYLVSVQRPMISDSLVLLININ